MLYIQILFMFKGLNPAKAIAELKLLVSGLRKKPPPESIENQAQNVSEPKDKIGKKPLTTKPQDLASGKKLQSKDKTKM